MFDPIRALLASSFSKKGISEAATDTTCIGVTSIKSTSEGGVIKKLPSFLQFSKSSVNSPSFAVNEFACAILYLPSSIA